jgi:long-subunit fatty acid transport protein
MILSTASAAAQPFVAPRFSFNFSNPGARSLGFGGAFAALADDATAAYANPAGLVQLTRLEVSVEGRLWSRSPSFLAGGRFEGEPTGVGLDTVSGPVVGRTERETAGPSFASVVLSQGRWSFGLYGHRLARFEIASESQGFFLEPCVGCFPAERFPGARERVDLEIVTAGLTAAYRVNERLSFGLGVVHSDVSLATVSDFYLPDDDSLESRFGRISFLPERLLSTTTLSIDGTDWTVNAGVLWSVTGQLSAGLFYRQGARADGSNRFEAPNVPDFPTLLGAAEFEVPDIWGAGLAYRSKGGRITLAGEVDRVGYAGLIRVVDSDGEDLSTREYLDAWEYHLGAEYALLRRRPVLAFRLGAWVEANGDDLIDDRFTHLAAGLGLAAESYQIDLAGDFSEEGDTASLSFIYSF